MENLPQWNPEELRKSPLFEPLRFLLSHFENNHFPLLQDLNSLLGLHAEIKLQSGKRLHFVEQELGKLAFESQYEPRCYLSGEVQTRENNFHDLFNALVWLTFPQSKAAINARHYRALTQAASALKSRRGKVRDMATLFDESGVIVAYSNSQLAKLLCDFKWKELFWLCREEVNAQMGFYLFGHGLYEKAMQPYVGMTGQGLLMPVEMEFFTWSMPQRMQYLDERVAEYLGDATHCRDTRELTPVPLLGIPGWSNDNERDEYYDNQQYFRPGRRAK
jgi:hypothetical protein